MFSVPCTVWPFLVPAFKMTSFFSITHFCVYVLQEWFCSPQRGGGDVVDHLNEGQGVWGCSTVAAHTLNENKKQYLLNNLFYSNGQWCKHFILKLGLLGFPHLLTQKKLIKWQLMYISWCRYHLSLSYKKYLSEQKSLIHFVHDKINACYYKREMINDYLSKNIKNTFTDMCNVDRSDHDPIKSWCIFYHSKFSIAPTNVCHSEICPIIEVIWLAYGFHIVFKKIATC